MRIKIEGIKGKIAELKEQLKDVKGTSTEVYTRIVGYYRAVQNWNLGKKEEYQHRVEFCLNEDKPLEIVKAEKEVETSQSEPIDILVNDKGAIKKYKLFYTDNCPGCPPVKNLLKQVHMLGEEINAGTKEGLEEAIRNNVSGTPTVLFLNEMDVVVNKAHTASQIQLMIA